MRTRKLFKKPKVQVTKKIHWVQCNTFTTRRMVWFGDTHEPRQTRPETHTLEMDTQDTEQNNGSAWIPPTCEMCSVMMIRPRYKHSASSVNKVNQKKEKCGAGGGSERHGEWAGPTWVSERYAGDGAQIDALSVCCPVQLGFEKSRKEGRVTERSHGTSSHRGKKMYHTWKAYGGQIRWKQLQTRAHAHQNTSWWDGKSQREKVV